MHASGNEVDIGLLCKYSGLVCTTDLKDCDEVFNYWEPAHYIQFGYGFQTWEYAPQYSLRSYAYLLLHVLISKIIELFSDQKIIMFYTIRLLLSLFSFFSECLFCSSISRNISPEIAKFTIFFLTFSPGMFISSSCNF